MEACSPGRSVRKSAARTTARASSCRSETPADTDEPVVPHETLLLQAQGLVVAQHLPQNTGSGVEIPQHSVHCVLDLRIALDSRPTTVSRHREGPGQRPP
ncbi:DNA-binding protein inhibitor ID-2-like [Sturnira hondurensis]|uniref:DNA-binding protein inhibitor ID-2-like n=1 Tax=Sturnira hondurensis TaxID=192404 RepID=UPI001879A558|nr:DNA-binding protein inhibitor ID-2-like [Sturnira hondurensis]